MEATSRWIWGSVVGAIGLLGLFMAAKAQDAPFELAGYLLFLFAIVFNFGIIRRYTGRPH